MYLSLSLSLSLSLRFRRSPKESGDLGPHPKWLGMLCRSPCLNLILQACQSIGTLILQTWLVGWMACAWAVRRANRNKYPDMLSTYPT
jgi:hypothetical protein